MPTPEQKAAADRVARFLAMRRTLFGNDRTTIVSLSVEGEGRTLDATDLMLLVAAVDGS